MKGNSSNGQLTAQINLGDHKKSGFDLSNNVLGTGKLGRIYPTRALHVAPSDTIKNDTKVAVQFEPLAVPMLANMYVRQEHFYAPYNIVWKNWDNFISGGEKLDYNGVVPNVSMAQMAFLVFEKFTDNVYLPIKAHLDGPLMGYHLYDKEKYYDYLDTVLAAIEATAEVFAIKDIVEEQREAVQVLRDMASNLVFTPAGTVSADDYVFRGYKKTDYSSMSEFWDTYENDYHVTGSKYVQELKTWIKETMNAQGFVLLPTSEGLMLLQGIYDIVKSFIGLGSNIDYLNMCRMSFCEFLYLVLKSLPEVSPSGVVPAPPVVNGASYNIEFESLDYSVEPLHILHLRANYNVWYNNYRDILLETECIEPQDGDVVTDEELFTLLIPRQRCWDKDAFTTALDNPGTGNVGVPVTNDSQGPYKSLYVVKLQDVGAENSTGGYFNVIPNVDGSNMYEVTIDGKTWQLPTAYLSGINPKDDSASNKEFTGFSLYALDAAQRAQKWLQKALFFGNRITDFYYMRFGVKHLDARLHKPELLASSTELVKLDVVMNNTNITTEAGGKIYQSVAGDRSAYASAYDNGNSYDRFCEEHGVILSYLTIMPQPTYAYGRSRDYSRLDQFDYAFSEFATLGMDAVYDSEISNACFKRDTKVFGYQGRYYDYKAKHSEEHGELLDSQDMYTFGRRFDMFSEEGAPKLNYAFVHCFPPLDMFVVDSKLADYFRFDMRHSTASERLLPAQSIYI